MHMCRHGQACSPCSPQGQPYGSAAVSDRGVFYVIVSLLIYFSLVFRGKDITWALEVTVNLLRRARLTRSAQNPA